MTALVRPMPLRINPIPNCRKRPCVCHTSRAEDTCPRSNCARRHDTVRPRFTLLGHILSVTTRLQSLANLDVRIHRNQFSYFVQPKTAHHSLANPQSCPSESLWTTSPALSQVAKMSHGKRVAARAQEMIPANTHDFDNVRRIGDGNGCLKFPKQRFSSIVRGKHEESPRLHVNHVIADNTSAYFTRLILIHTKDGWHSGSHLSGSIEALEIGGRDKTVQSFSCGHRIVSKRELRRQRSIPVSMSYKRTCFARRQS